MVFDAETITLFALAFARAAAWLAASPLFTSNGISWSGRIALAVALAMFVAPQMAGTANPPTDLFDFVTVLAGQIAVGLVLGWITGLALAVFQAAGAVIDITSGFSVGAILDPATGTQNAVFARLFTLAFLALFFATNAHLAVVAGFVRSFDAVPPDELPLFGADSVALIGQATADFMLAAMEIAAPVLGALILTEVALAFAARLAPQANIFLIGLPLKMLVALTVAGSTLVFLPYYTETVVDSTLDLGTQLIG